MPFSVKSSLEEKIENCITVIETIIVSINREEKILRPHTDPYKKYISLFGSSLAVCGNLLFIGAPDGDADNVEGGAGFGDAGQGFVEVFYLIREMFVKNSIKAYMLTKIYQ